MSNLFIIVPAMMTLLSSAAHGSSFVAFESGPVRPVALSPGGERLFVANTPDNRLEIFDVTPLGLRQAGSIPVGMEPVAVAMRGGDEVWVVNHLSDSVSIIRGAAGVAPRLVETLLVGDAPRDIVFAGPDGDRAFITTAHRGQNSPVNVNPFTEQQGRADVWVFDASAPNEPLEIIVLFGDTPRALAATPDGSTVYAAIFQSGNQTTTLSSGTVAGDMPPPLDNADGVVAPWTGLVVKHDGVEWRDGAGRIWTDALEVSLPDWDVFVIDAGAASPRVIDRIAGVGTTLFNMAVNPVSSSVYVSNTEARNHVRFEGPGIHGGSTVRGHFVESRITIINNGEAVPRHLNHHIDYESFPGTPAEGSASLATPMQMQVSGDGETLYVAAFGSAKVGVFDTAELEAGTFVPDEAMHIQLSGGGPSGIALDENRNRLYVTTRFDNAISVVDLSTNSEVQHLAMYNPEPAAVVNGRRFLYDARYTSSRGDSSCGGCHTFGDTDHLAWDLGNPDGPVEPNPNPLNGANPPRVDFHPMKGPMGTQTLRGLATHGIMHWRGDRTGAAQPGGDAFDEEAAFRAFNRAFEDLLGRTSQLTDEEMQAFTDFALLITPPPNPNRLLDNSLREDEERGRQMFFERLSPDDAFCVDCHAVDREIGFFGTNGLTGTAFSGTPEREQAMKVPQLRNLYTKIGLFHTASKDPQIRGFGFMHDAAMPTLLNFFLNFPVFSGGAEGVRERRDVAKFIFAFETELAPIVGQQRTVSVSSDASAAQRVLLLRERALANECDLIAKGRVGEERRGYLLDTASGRFQSDRSSEPQLSLGELYAMARTEGQAMTFTCAPPGSGMRMGLDRDEDGFLDRDEIDAGSDPGDPGSVP